jgi:hypothetical protein
VFFCDAILDAAKHRRVSRRIAVDIVQQIVEAREVEAKLVEAKQVEAKHQELAKLSGPEMEREYTALIQDRQLYEGACELPWSQYFAYRDQHAGSAPLSSDDLRYVGQWTNAAPAVTAEVAQPITIDQKFGFRPPKEFFWTVVFDEARLNPFHPVREYLASLTWDGKKRIDTWLIDYGQAQDTPYTRQTLVEVSLCAVPANPSALLQAKAMGVSTETIKKIFRQQNKNASLAERIEDARASIKYSQQQKDAIMRKARAKLGKSKSQPKLLTTSKDVSDRVARSRASTAKAKAMLAKAKHVPKVPEPELPDHYTYITWRGMKIPVPKRGLGGAGEEYDKWNK